MKRKRKQLMAYLLSAAMVVTSLMGFSRPITVVSEAAVYNGNEILLQNPVIQEDDSLSAGQAVTYDCVYFGSYPQAEVITAKMSKNYTAINSAYYNEEKDVVVSDDVYARLQEATDWDSSGDIVIDGRKYRRMRKEDETKSQITVTTPEARYQWEDSDTYHYFQYQPIKWRILNVENNSALLHADIALDFQNYHNYKENITWMRSTLRSWISREFINYAFSNEEQSAIISSTVENKDNFYYGTSGGFPTAEKVFLLSESEAYDTTNAESYGFTSGKTILDEARKRKSSTYAKAKGVYSLANGNCVWWLRSPGVDQTWAVSVLGNGTVNYYGTSVYAASAVCPALYLDLSYDSLYTYAGTVCTDEESEETLEIKREEAEEAAMVDSGMPLKKIKISPKETQVVRGDTKVIKLKNVVSWNKAKGKQKKVSWTIKNKNKVIKKSVKGKYNQRLRVKVKRLGSTTVTAKFNGKKYTATVSGVKTITREDGEDEDEDGEEEPEEDDTSDEDENYDGFDLKTNGYSFVNTRKSFGYEDGYKIPYERYVEALKDVSIQMYNQISIPWSGSCFGMSASAVLFSKNTIQLSSYPKIAVDGLNVAGYDERKDGWRGLNTDSELTKLIERYQIWQYSGEYREKLDGTMYSLSDGSEQNAGAITFANLVYDVETNKEPYLLSVWWNKDETGGDGSVVWAGHALAVDSSRGIEDLSDENSPDYKGEGWKRIYLYDPNVPYYKFYKEKSLKRYIDVNVINGRWWMAVSTNSDGSPVEAGYDEAGNVLRNSYVRFTDTSDFSDLTVASYTYDEEGTSCISYSCNDFYVTGSDGQDVFSIKNGCIVYQDMEKTELYISTDEIAVDGNGSEVASGKLILQGNGYTVHTASEGVIAIMEDGVYKGVNVKGNMCLTDSGTNELTISAQSYTEDVYIVLETSDDDGYIAVGTDADISSGTSTFSLKDKNFACDTEIPQILNLDISDNLGNCMNSSVDTSKILSSQETEEKKNDVEIEESPKISVSLDMGKTDDVQTDNDKADDVISYKAGMTITDNTSGAVYKITRYTESDRTVEYVKPISKNATKVVIPAEITVDSLTFKVTSIAGKAFYKNEKLKQVVIGKNVQTIGNRAFYGCKNLVMLTIKTQKLVKSRVGRDAFSKVNPKAIVKVPGKKLDSYTKLLIAKGLSKKTKIKK